MFDELLRQAGVVETVSLRSTFGFMAFHGGLEAGTETVATEAARRSGSSCYVVVQPPSLVWHIPSALVSPEQSVPLSQFLDHVDVVVAVHGYGRRDRPDQLLLGGGNRGLAAHVAANLRRQDDGFTIVDDISAIPVELRGLHPNNPVNRTRNGGVQVELPPRARGTSPSPGRRGEPCVPAQSVIAGLAEAASSWTG